MGQVSLFPADLEDEYLLKHVNAVALMPTVGGRRITALGRKMFSVLLYRSQQEGEREEYEARLHEILELAAYNSNDTSPVRKILRELMSTTVEWQSPSSGEIETWDACNLLSGAGTTKDKRTNAVTVRWRFDSKIRAQLLSPDRYARLSLEAITTLLNTHAAMALYDICARYVDNPGHKTARQHWRWWRPVLTGVAGEYSKGEYRFFKRDVLHKAVAEINACTNLEVRGPIEYKEQDNRTIADIQFEVRLKDGSRSVAWQRPLSQVADAELPSIGRAINAGVKQLEAEELIRKFGAFAFADAVGELEKRLRMPDEKVGAVLRPGGWLRAILARAARETAVAVPAAPEISQEVLNKHRAAWTDEWLRRTKERLRAGFQESNEAEQRVFLEAFRRDLVDTSQRQVLKRFDASGWQNKLVLPAFTKFYALRTIGESWDKPTSDDILAIAVELGTAKG